MTRSAILFESQNFRYSADITPLERPAGSYWLTIRSRWADARHPEADQVRFSACLDGEGLQALSDLARAALITRNQGESK